MYVNSRTVWSIELVPGQASKLYREMLTRKTKKTNKKDYMISYNTIRLLRNKFRAGKSLNLSRGENLLCY